MLKYTQAQKCGVKPRNASGRKKVHVPAECAEHTKAGDEGEHRFHGFHGLSTEGRQGNEGLGFLDGINRIARILRIILDEETQTKRDARGQRSEANQGCLTMDEKMNPTMADPFWPRRRSWWNGGAGVPRGTLCWRKMELTPVTVMTPGMTLTGDHPILYEGVRTHARW